MRHIVILATVLTVVAMAGNNRVLAEVPFLDRSILLTGYEEAKAGDDISMLDAGDSCAVMEDCIEDCPTMIYCGPKWTVGAGAVIKKWNKPPKRNLVYGDEGILMTADDVAVEWGSGPWVELIRHTDCGWDFEVEFFCMDNLTSEAVAYNGTPAATWYWQQFRFDELRTFYSHDLYSLEFNVRRPLSECGRFVGLAGFHWFDLREQFITEVSLTQAPFGVLTNRGEMDIHNHLYGFQLGAEGILWEPSSCFRVEGLCKAGIYANCMDTSLVTEGDLDNRTTTAEKVQSAFVSELALMAVYQPCCSVKVFAGYEALHFKEVATLFVQETCSAIPDHSFYHGVVLGVEISFGSRYCGGCADASCSCE